jgi:hypothetical protein
MAGARCKNGFYKNSKEVAGRQNRNKEKTRKSWTEVDGLCQIGLKNMSMKRWRMRALDRAEGVSVVGEAKTRHKGV